jgi:hypothetical protein
MCKLVIFRTNKAELSEQLRALHNENCDLYRSPSVVKTGKSMMGRTCS